ncbi:hypothetical protein BDN72DRAFT_929677, partial [Pluteus cervinus]
MDLRKHLSKCILCIYQEGFTLSTFLSALLSCDLPLATNEAAARDNLYQNASAICSSLYKASDGSRALIDKWSLEVVEKKLCEEVHELSQERHGLQFHANKATSKFMEGSIARALLDANPNRRRIQLATQAFPSREDFEEALDAEPTELGDGQEGEISTGADNNRDSGPTKRQQRAAERNAALLSIVRTFKSVVSLSIYLQSTNERCNYLQSIMGIFFHSTGTPEKVIEVLAHAGLSVSVSTINRSVESLSKEAAEKVKQSAQTLMASWAYDNFDSMFKVAEPTVGRSSTLVSATSATLIPLFGVEDKEVLRCSKEL